MLQAENDCGTERKTKRRIKAAKFALRPSFEDFDFAAKPLAHWTEVIADAIRHRLADTLHSSSTAPERAIAASRLASQRRRTMRREFPLRRLHRKPVQGGS